MYSIRLFLDLKKSHPKQEQRVASPEGELKFRGSFSFLFFFHHEKKNIFLKQSSFFFRVQKSRTILFVFLIHSDVM